MHIFLLALTLMLGTLTSLQGAGSEVIIRPQSYSGPIRNPLMGFVGPTNGNQPYATLSFQYVKWNAIESNAADGADKIREYTDARWGGVEKRNLKIIPRVYLELPKGSGMTSYWPIISFWPADLPRGYDTPQFKERVLRMVAKMGEAWDLDPRIAFVEMGIIGAWGEQHHPSPDDAMQKWLGDAFQRAFKHKLVMIRYPWQFTQYPFGIYWDSFGNPGWEMRKHVPVLEGPLADRWQVAPMGGEMSFSSDTNVTVPRLALTPTAAVAEHADTLTRYIRRWHWTALAWVSNYDLKDPVANVGASKIQSAFGYRYVIDEVRYSAHNQPGGKLSVSFKVRNLGSAPMYYDWPVEASLLDPKTHEPVWKSTFARLDIRKWLPGNFSDIGKSRPVGEKGHNGFEWDTGQEYDIPAAAYEVDGTFSLPATLAIGKYILALAILDPAGNLPAVKFAISNYFKGGRHPIGQIGVGIETAHPELDPTIFEDSATDTSLHYIVEQPRQNKAK